MPLVGGREFPYSLVLGSIAGENRMPDNRVLVSLDLYDCSALGGALLIALGLMLIYAPLAFVWVGVLLLVPSILGAKIWASRHNKKNPSSSSKDPN